MTASFIVVYEAQADFTTATELADRVLTDEITWLDETLLDSQRQWIGGNQSGARLTWQSISIGARKLGIRVRGHFDGGPALPDAKAASRAIAYVLASFDAVDAILLIRDRDDQVERQSGLEQARNRFAAAAVIVVGLAIPERECWVISGFDPANDDE